MRPVGASLQSLEHRNKSAKMHLDKLTSTPSMWRGLSFSPCHSPPQLGISRAGRCIRFSWFGMRAHRIKKIEAAQSEAEIDEHVFQQLIWTLTAPRPISLR